EENDPRAGQGGERRPRLFRSAIGSSRARARANRRVSSRTDTAAYSRTPTRAGRTGSSARSRTHPRAAMISRRSLIASCSFIVVASSFLHAADEAPKLDPRYPFRTDYANAQLPWYKPKPLEFPPHHSDRRISGEFVSADFVHRTGQFRMSKTGELVDFTMPPYGAINYLNAQADLRDVPLGTFFLFFLNQDSSGGFTRLATMQDQFTMDMGAQFYLLPG
ncbi:MAG: hypothetical protein JWO08_1456, partial [Verrucomicrobiaceae bacterium]|nr:hypothetical protein [Verrucomicrobiaceae bacterium]